MVSGVVLGLLWICASAVAAGDAAPLDREFVKWREGQRSPGAVFLQRTPLAALVPDPVDRRLLAGTVVAPQALAYPASYDLRAAGRVSAVKDQSPFGTCWAFAAVSSLESALLPGDPLDISEDHVTLTAGFDMGGDPYGHGGNFSMTTAYFARWGGPVLESQDPYGDGVSPSGLPAARQVQEVLYVPGGTSGTDTQNIKYAVMEFGAVASEIYFGKPFFNEVTRAHYYYGTEYPNHAVAIVGWDDLYPAGNFRTAPPADGAWLMKNNWGPGWGQDGYFWMSYYDRYAGSAESHHAVFGTVQPAGTYTDIYSYDPLGQVNGYGLGLIKMWGANVFTAHADQSIVALGFYTPVPASSYTVYAGTSLESLTAQGSGTIAFPGFHTVPLKKALAVTSGSRFVVAVRLVTPGTEYPLAVEYYLSDYSSDATAESGQSYVKTDDTTWMDLTDWNASANVCLKAYAGTPMPTVVDSVAPSTTVGGADDTWHATPVALTLSAVDPGEEASGVAYTEYRVDQGAWTRGTTLEVSASGVHTVAYRSVDVAGNVEAEKSCVVRIDTRGPTCTAQSVRVKRGATVRLRFRIADDVSPLVKYTVSVRTGSGVTKAKLVAPDWRPAGAWRTWSFSVSLERGTYRVVVRGEDLAGNREAAAGRGTLEVK